MTNNKKGFTLIELLVVIAIIGILSAIGLVSLNGAREKARDSKRKSDLASVRVALELYKDDQALFTYPVSGIATMATALTSLTTGGAYLAVLPATPSAGTSAVNDYYYISNAAAITGVSGTVADYGLNQAFALLTKLEGGTKPWYVLNNIGGVDVQVGTGVATATPGTTGATVVVCSATTAGTTTIHACLNTPTYTS